MAHLRRVKGTRWGLETLAPKKKIRGHPPISGAHFFSGGDVRGKEEVKYQTSSMRAYWMAPGIGLAKIGPMAGGWG